MEAGLEECFRMGFAGRDGTQWDFFVAELQQAHIRLSLDQDILVWVMNEEGGEIYNKVGVPSNY